MCGVGSVRSQQVMELWKRRWGSDGEGSCEGGDEVAKLCRIFVVVFLRITEGGVVLNCARKRFCDCRQIFARMVLKSSFTMHRIWCGWFVFNRIRMS